MGDEPSLWSKFWDWFFRAEATLAFLSLFFPGLGAGVLAVISGANDASWKVVAPLMIMAGALLIPFGIWLIGTMRQRSPGRIGAVESAPLVSIARKEKDSLAEVVLLIQAELEVASLSNKNPRIVVHFSGFNGAVFPIRLSSQMAEGHVGAPSGEVFPSEVELRFTGAEEIRRGSVFIFELSVAITDESAEMLRTRCSEQNYMDLHFNKVRVFVSTVGGFDDSAKHQLDTTGSIRFNVAQNRRRGPTSLLKDKFNLYFDGY